MFTEEILHEELHFLCRVSYLTKYSTKFTRFCDWSYLSSYNYFLEICCDAIKNTHCYQFLCKGLKVFPWKIFCRYCGFGFHWSIKFSRNFEKNLNKNVNFRKILKIIIINENSFLQMYPKVMIFLTYWFLRIKWLFAKSVKITTETAIHKNRFLQSFKKNPVYSLVIEVVWQKVSFVMICWKQYRINIFHKL